LRWWFHWITHCPDSVVCKILAKTCLLDASRTHKCDVVAITGTYIIAILSDKRALRTTNTILLVGGTTETWKVICITTLAGHQTAKRVAFRKFHSVTICERGSTSWLWPFINDSIQATASNWNQIRVAFDTACFSQTAASGIAIAAELITITPFHRLFKLCGSFDETWASTCGNA
jgi:hypothetical protein